jgi:hypothetical protein
MIRRERSRNYQRAPEEEQAALELENVMHKVYGDPTIVPTGPVELAAHRARAKRLFGFDQRTVTGQDGIRTRVDWTPAELMDEERVVGEQEDIERNRRLVSLTAAGIDTQQSVAIGAAREPEVQAITQLARAVLIRVIDHPTDDYFSEVFRPRYQKEEKALLEILRRTIFRSVANFYDYEDETGIEYRSDDLRGFEERRSEDFRLHPGESYQEGDRRREREDFERLEAYDERDWDALAKTESAICLEFLKRQARMSTDRRAEAGAEKMAVARVVQEASSLVEVLPRIEATLGLRMGYDELLDVMEIPDHLT